MMRRSNTVFLSVLCITYMGMVVTSPANSTNQLDIVGVSSVTTSRIAKYDVENMESEDNSDTKKKSTNAFFYSGFEDSKGDNNEIQDDRFKPRDVASLATIRPDQDFTFDQYGTSTVLPGITFLMQQSPKAISRNHITNTDKGQSIFRNNTSSIARNTEQPERYRINTSGLESKKNRPKRGKDNRPEILAGIIVPALGNRPFRVMKVGPALEKALEDISVGGWHRWNFKRLSLIYVDSKCDIAISMNEAIQLAERKRVSVFFGPVCDFPLAPVARQAPYWNIPVLTTGAIAYQFEYRKSDTYRTLTRLGPANFKDMLEFLEDVFAANLWKKLKIIYNSVGQEDVLISFCHFLTEYTHVYLLSRGSNITMDLEKIDKQDAPPDLDHVMRKDVGADHAGTLQPDQFHKVFFLLPQSDIAAVHFSTRQVQSQVIKCTIKTE